MTKKGKKCLISLFTVLLLFTIGTSAMADDDDEHDHDEKYEYNLKSDDDEDDEELKNEQQTPFNAEQQNEYWNIWSREPRNDPNNALPITAPSEVKVLSDTKEMRVYLIPQDGQLLASIDALATVLGAERTYYPQSKIAKLTKADLELVVRSGSNAAFENKLKTPMPTKAVAYENSLYIPVSVGANAFGYRVLWDNKKSLLIFQSIN